MPIIWRLLLSWYLKLFALSAATLLCLLMTVRLHDIAALSTLGMPWPSLILYTFYQIPSILPIVIAFSAFLAPLLIGRFLFKGQELTALSACCLPVRELLLPVIFAAFFLSCANFYFVSELATTSHLKSRQMIADLQRTSPLALLKQHHLIDRGHFTAFSKSTFEGLSKDFVFVFYQSKSERLGLIKAGEISLANTDLLAKDVLLIGTKNSGKGEHLWIENIGLTKTKGDLLSWLGISRWRALLPDYLPLRSLTEENRHISEFGRRIAFSLAPLTLSLLSFSYAFTYERHKKILVPSFLALGSLVLIFISKSFFQKPLLALTLQLTPQVFICLWAFRRLYRQEKGDL